MRAILLSGGLALIISLVGTRYAIKLLSAKGYGQEIREDGPTSHHTKRGTPTMGGIVIILASVAGYFFAKIITQDLPSASAMLLLFLFVGLGVVGFLDDFIKIYKQRNLGLRSKAKMIGQTRDRGRLRHPGAVPVAGGLPRRDSPASQHISFIRDWEWLTLPAVVVIVLIWVIVTGTSNAVNLTDGLDGLAAGASMMVFGAYTLVNIWQNNQWCGQVDIAYGRCYEVRDPLDLAIVSAAITGACFGFLWWNASPAQIFMGDTGSLSLGGAMAGLAILTRTELLLLVIGGLFVVETLSVMLQVGFFKVTKGRRIFRMAPLHHHFEMLGWEQVTVVIRFWIITGLCVAAGLGIFYAEWVAGT